MAFFTEASLGDCAGLQKKISNAKTEIHLMNFFLAYLTPHSLDHNCSSCQLAKRRLWMVEDNHVILTSLH